MLRTLAVTTMTLLLFTGATAYDLGGLAPVKQAASGIAPPADPIVQRQGGDLITSPTFISVPYTGTGTTLGYADNYDEACPYTDSTAPDVVYAFTPANEMYWTIDMLGSSYDTKIYIYDVNLELIACNDDYYPDYVSKIEYQPLAAGVLHYLIIDGYGTEAGDYVVTITEHEPCHLSCPDGAQLEGEPPLVEGYVDNFNSGCGSEGSDYPFSVIEEPVYCGRSGWYWSFSNQYRDTDWMEITVPDVGSIEIVGDAEIATYMFELAPQDCGSVAVVQNVVCGPCNPGTMVIPGEPGSTVWFWMGPTVFDGEGEYDYVLWLNLDGPIATEAHSWSAVKQLFNE